MCIADTARFQLRSGMIASNTNSGHRRSKLEPCIVTNAHEKERKQVEKCFRKPEDLEKEDESRAFRDA